MPDNEAPNRAFYDHEIDEPRATGRRRRQVADWGVGEDVFDRLPTRRFARTERRGEDTRERPRQSATRDDSVRHSEPAPRRPPRRPAADWLEEVSPRPAAESRTIVLGGDREEEIVLDGTLEEEIAPPADTPRRTIVIDGDVDEIAPPEAPGPAEDVRAAHVPDQPRPRRTVVIGGHPDKLPAPRPRRPPRTAVERMGASPDRLAAYAVGLGLLLILIAVLTTGH